MVCTREQKNGLYRHPACFIHKHYSTLNVTFIRNYCDLQKVWIYVSKECRVHCILNITLMALLSLLANFKPFKTFEIKF